MDIKRCSKCKQNLPLSEFWKDRRKPDGKRTACRSCAANDKEYMKNYYAANKDGSIREWREKNKESLNQKTRAWQVANPEKYKENKRRSDLRRYSMTLEEYELLFAAQGGLCAICQNPPFGARPLSVDHDHACCPENARSCGKCVRGLLCSKCNSLLGNATDSEDTLISAIDYLRRWNNVRS